MKPLNRRLLIEITEEEPQQGTFFVPVEEKVEEFLTAKVILLERLLLFILSAEKK